MPRHLFIALLLPWVAVPGRALDWQPAADLAVTWHGNVTNADRPRDRVAALQSVFELGGRTARQVTGRDVVSAAWQLRLETWPRFDGLDAAQGGLTAGWRHKFGLGPQALVLDAEATTHWLGVREADRSGSGHRLRFQASRRLGPAWQVFLGTERTGHDARRHAFTHHGRTDYLRAAYRPAGPWLLALELRRRAGIVVSYTTPPRPDLVEAGHPLTLVDTFERGTPLLAYYFPADTLGVGFTAQRDLTRRRSAYLRFAYGETTHGSLRYLNSRTTLGFTQGF